MALRGKWSDDAARTTYDGVIWRITRIELNPSLNRAQITLAAYHDQAHADAAKADPNVQPIGRQETNIAVLDEPDQMQTIHGKEEVAKVGAKDYTRYFGVAALEKGGANPVRQAYLAAKEHPLFRDATDVLETEPKALAATR